MDKLKKGIVSHDHVVDAAYIDTYLTVAFPPRVAAGTGMEAITHYKEAYTDKLALPIVEM